MTIREAAQLLGAEILHEDFDNDELSGVYTSDLLSDVMANGRNSSVLITIQAHLNTIAVAYDAGISLVIVCNSRSVPEDMLNAARRERIALFKCRECQFTVSGMLFKMGLRNQEN